MSRGILVAATVGAIVVGAAAGVLFAGWAPTGTPRYRGMHLEHGHDGRPVRWARSQSRIDLPDRGWRPLRVVLWLEPAPRAPEAGMQITIAAGDVSRPFLVTAGVQPYELTLSGPSAGSDLVVRLASETIGAAGRGVRVLHVEARPVFSWRPAMRWGALGAATGLALLAVLLAPSFLPRWFRRGEETVPVPRAAGAACRPWLIAALFAYFAVWACLKPPLQVPDEGTHLIKAYSMPRAPWFASSEIVPLPPGVPNPIAFGLNPTSKLPFQDHQRLSADDVQVLKSMRWYEPGASPGEGFSQAWTYPPLFYWSVVALGQATTVVLRLEPYDSLYAYRLSAGLLASLLWWTVFVTLGELPGLAGRRVSVFVFLVSNPMLAFLSSGINPDSVQVPLSTLAAAWTFLALTEGRRQRLAAAALVLCLLTKPAGLVLAAALGATVLTVVAARRVPLDRALPTMRTLVLVTVAGVAFFYAWRPSQLYGVGVRALGFRQYVADLAGRVAEMWVQYWGRLGWLDYSLPAAFYVVLFVVWAANAAMAAPLVRAWWREIRFPAWMLLVGAFYLTASIAAGPASGFTFQGRYLLPVALAPAMALMHGRTWLRATLVGYLVVFNLLMLDRTVQRYFAGGWDLALRALPFVGS